MDIKNWGGVNPLAAKPRTQTSDEPEEDHAPATELDKWLTDATARANAIKSDAVVAGGDTRHPRIVIVGKAPAQDEVRQGRPFAGASGGRNGLQRMLKPLNMSLRDSGGAIATNAGFWFAKAGQDPSTKECAYSAPIIAELIERVKPKIILALGARAAETLIGITSAVAMLRGRWHICSLIETGAPVRVTYHPAYLLREPNTWHRAESDIEAVRKKLTELSR